MRYADVPNRMNISWHAVVYINEKKRIQKSQNEDKSNYNNKRKGMKTDVSWRPDLRFKECSHPYTDISLRRNGMWIKR